MSTAQMGLVEVYGLWSTSFAMKPWMIVLFLILIGIVVYYALTRLRSKRYLSPEQVALQELYRLQNHSYVSQQAVHDAYFKLTAIVKTYLVNRFLVTLHDKSDTEIVELLHGNLSENMILLLQEFFDRAFRIKFAYDVVSEQMLFDDIAFLQRFVIETNKPVQSPGKP